MTNPSTQTEILFPMAITLIISLMAKLKKCEILPQAEIIDIFDVIIAGLEDDDIRKTFIQGLRSSALGQTYEEHLEDIKKK